MEQVICIRIKLVVVVSNNSSVLVGKNEDSFALLFNAQQRTIVFLVENSDESWLADHEQGLQAVPVMARKSNPIHHPPPLLERRDCL
jgi:hypothetical protein